VRQSRHQDQEEEDQDQEEEEEEEEEADRGGWVATTQAEAVAWVV